MNRSVQNRTIQWLLIAFCLFVSSRALFAQGYASGWPEYHKKDLSKWAAKSGLSFSLLTALTKTATEDDLKDVEEKDLRYTIENIDAKSLSMQKHILLSTWDAGTGHCLTLYVLTREGSHFEKVWQSYDNLCTRSILGVAKTQATPDGRIIVRYREYSVDSDPKKEALPILKVTVTYKWDGSSYIKVGHNERPGSHVE